MKTLNLDCSCCGDTCPMQAKIRVSFAESLNMLRLDMLYEDDSFFAKYVRLNENQVISLVACLTQFLDEKQNDQLDKTT